MWLVRLALRRPVSILVGVLSLALASALAVVRMPVDIFPELGAPAVYVAQPYGGLDPRQMEAFATYYYEYHFLYINGIEHVESKSIQSASLMKLVFHPGTDMNQAVAETVAFVNRARALMPPGAVPPFVLRYDAGSVPVAQLVFSSPNRDPGEMQDIALNLVRPVLATIPGVSAPPPFGGNQRTIVVRLDPDQMRQYKVSPEEAVAAIRGASSISPSGNVRTGDLIRITTNNGTLGDDLEALLDSPVRTGYGPTVYLRDVATMEDGTDIIVGYAHVDGRRTVYIPVTKRSDASTLAVVQSIRDALPQMRAVVPDDVELSLEFDQSQYVLQAISSLVTEGLLGAVLTGLVVLLFLRDVRSAIIIVLTIPFSLLAALVCLWATGQTVNIMTLGGLALSVGLLVDQAVVFVESLHTQLARGLPPAQAVVAAARLTSGPLLMARLAILAVFLPSFFMTGVGGQLFVPLTLAVAFAMIASYVLASTLVPVLSAQMLRERSRQARARLGDAVQQAYRRVLGGLLAVRVPLLAAYLIATLGFLGLAVPRLGTEIFPEADAGQFQLRLRAPTGTRIERTEIVALDALNLSREEAGAEHVRISTAFIGIQGSAYPVNTIYLWTGGPHEAVLKVALGPGAPLRGAALRERLRERFRERLPGVEVSFEAGDIVSQVMSFGSNTDVEVAVQGFDLEANRAHAAKIQAELMKVAALRDLQFGQKLDYPTLHVDVDRIRAGQVGLTVQNVARSLIAATSSTRFVEANFWPDARTGVAYQIQAEIPQDRMTSPTDVESVPILAGGGPRPVLVGDVATISEGTMPGEIHRYNMQRLVSLTANVHGQSLGEVADDVRAAVARAGTPPRGVTVAVRGRIPPLEETITGLRNGLLLTVAVIFLLLAGNFQSFRLGVAIIVIVPAVLCGVVLMLLATGTTLNIQSFMGTIMVLGIAGADSILLIAYAERFRREGRSPVDAAREGGCARLRALLMTVTAMTAGMLPLALAFGGGAEQAAPLGRAVIGGLLSGTLATMFVLPAVYAVFQAKAPQHHLSLDPDDPTSPHHAGHVAVTVLAGVLMAAPAALAQSLELVRVEAQRVARTIQLPGEFAPYQRVSVFARVPSFVQEVHVDRGSLVRQGQLLVTLTAPELAAQVAESEARAQAVLLQLAEADAKLVSARTTADMLKMASSTPGAVSASELVLADQAFQAAQSVRNAVENSAKAARAAAEAVQELASYLEVRAPFDGVITERFVHPGALVGPATAGVSTPLVQIEQNTRLRLVVAVPEAHVAGIVRGAAVTFTVPAHPGESFTATIARPARALDARTRSMMVELDAANVDGRLATGMFADVAWPVRRPSTSLVVPATAVVTTTERTFVIRSRDGRAEWVTVRRGSTIGEMVEVFGDLRAGDPIVRRGNDEIRSGARIAPTAPQN